MIIGIDKGHTIQNGGCPGANGIKKESIENRLIGNKVIDYLRLLGHRVIDCSCDYAPDVNTQLVSIVNKANAQHLDLFVSLHLNAGGGTGAEVYTTNTSGAKQLARKLINDYCNRLGYWNRGHKEAEFYVLRKTEAPAMLLEMYFCDSAKDCQRADNLRYENIAKVIVESITGEKVKDRGVKMDSKLYNKVKNSYVRYGSTGNNVIMLQAILQNLGYEVNGIDGHCGNGCVNAIKKYQADNDLDIDGSFGPQCWKSLLY